MTTSIIAGSLFEYSVDEGTTYIQVDGISELPEFKQEQGERDVTSVSDTVKQFDEEMDSPTEQTVTAFYLKDNSAQLAFRTLCRNSADVIIRVTYSDGDIAEVPVKLKNYGINSGAAEATKMWSVVMRRTAQISFTESV